MLWLISSISWSPTAGGVLFIFGTMSVEIFVSSPESEPKSMGPHIAIAEAASFISSSESDPGSIGISHANLAVVIFSSSSDSESWFCCTVVTVFCFLFLSFLSDLNSRCSFQQLSSSCPSFSQCVQEGFAPLLLVVAALFGWSFCSCAPLFLDAWPSH